VSGARTVGRYEFRSLLGSGGIGRVYAAFDQKLGRMVAVKALRPELNNDQSFIQRFHAEAASLAPLNHPNITTLYDLVQADGEEFMVMELVHGHTLEDVLAQRRQLGQRECLAIVAQAAAGLSYAHRMNVVHRDIKPANLMLTDTGVLKIMDFGIARVQGSQRMTRAGSLVGTLAYVAPEQIKGSEGDARTDIYSLACVLYEMLSGDPPFQSDSDYGLIRAQVDTAPQPLRDRLHDLDPAIEGALLRALSKDPDQRFASADEFSRAVGAAAIQGEAADIVRDHIVASLPRQPPPATRMLDAASLLGSGAASRGAASAPAVPVAKPANTGDGRARKRTPILVLGGVVAVLAIGLLYVASDSFLGSSPGEPPGPQAPSAVLPATNLARVGATSAQPHALPPSSTIMPAPDARAPAAAASDTQASTDAIKGVVTTFSPDGWPVIAGQVVRLVGVEGIAPDLVENLKAWVRDHGGYLDCKTAPPSGFHCLTAEGLDVSKAILWNGAAKAAADAAPTYRSAEQHARDAKVGLWQ
jgi:serine/threonine-protein kinase